MSIHFTLYLFLFFISSAFSFRIHSYTSLKYNDIEPSLVYQMISNGTESKNLHKVETMLCYAEQNLKTLKEKSEKRYNSILSECNSKYWTSHCDEIEVWRENIEDLIMEKGLVKRNLSEAQENIEDIQNHTLAIKIIFERKINETTLKLEQKTADLNLIEEVEKLIQEGLLQNQTDQQFLQMIPKKTFKLLQKKSKRRFQGSEIGKEIMKILSEIKFKLIREINKLKAKNKLYENELKKRLLLLSKEKAENEQKIEELEEKLKKIEEKQLLLEEKVKKCEEIKKFQKERCLNIESNGTIVGKSLEKELALLEDIASQLNS